MTKPIVYLAGPMTGIKHFNVEKFVAVANQLRSFGYEVRNPAEHDIEMGFNPYAWNGTESLEETGFDLDEALRWDLEQVRKADAVVQLPLPNEDWISKGLNLELDEARKNFVPVFLVELDKYSDRIIDDYTHSTNDSRPLLPCQKCYSGTLVGKQKYRKAIEEDEALFFSTSQVWNLINNPDKVNRKRSQPVKAPYAQGGYDNPSGEVFAKYPYVNPGAEYTLSAADVEKFGGPLLKSLKTAENNWTGDKGEVRTVSSTGGEKGTKLARYDLLPVDALKQVAEHYGRGAEKYDANQWRKGYEWSKSFAALMRHAQQFWGGEDFDEETGSNHMAAVAWHAFTLLTFYKDFPDFDDRYKGEEE